jgi:hypothetical protein
MGVGVSRYFGTPWLPRESNSILKIFSLACRPLTQESQVMIMLEYPSRSNLNCFKKFYGAPAGGEKFFNPRKVSTPLPLENVIIIVGSSGLEPLPIRTRFTVSLPYPNDFYYPIFVPREGIEPPPFPCKRNTLPLRHRGKMYVSELPIYKHTN